MQRVVVVLLCLSLGMHWGVLQGIAWTGMLVSNLTGGSVMEAVEKTFDGDHPCPLCLAVKEGQKREKDDSKPALAKSVKKLDVVLWAENQLIPPTGRKLSFEPFLVKTETRFDEVKRPPPRAAVMAV